VQGGVTEVFTTTLIKRLVLFGAGTVLALAAAGGAISGRSAFSGHPAAVTSETSPSPEASQPDATESPSPEPGDSPEPAVVEAPKPEPSESPESSEGAESDDRPAAEPSLSPETSDDHSSGDSGGGAGGD
jgi:hypothetical protein